MVKCNKETFHVGVFKAAESKLRFSRLVVSEPTFVSMAQMPESERSDSGDDDKVYLFFSETAVECDCYSKLVVSRVARVCKVIKSFKLLVLPVTIANKRHFLCLCSCGSFPSASSLSVFFHSSYISVLTGGYWWGKNFAKEVDIFLEGKNRLSGPGVPAAVRYPGRVPLV